MLSSTIRHAPRRRLFSFFNPKGKTPFILSVGGAPPGTPAPLCASNTPLATYTENFYDMSDFEKDFVVRCYEFLCAEGQLKPSPACTAALQAPTGPSDFFLTDPSRKITEWSPFFDLVMLPDGSVFFGWFRRHPLDSVWIRQTAAYVDDLWHRAPGKLYALHKERLHDIALRSLQHRQRNLQVFLPAMQVSTAQVSEDLQWSARLFHTASRKIRPLEDKILFLCCSEHATPTNVRDLLGKLEKREEALSTGSAVALLRILVSTYALYGNSKDNVLVGVLRATAARVCDLTRDSSVALPLTWAAGLLCCKSDVSTVDEAQLVKAATTLASPSSDGPGNMLVAALHAVVEPSVTHRVAVLCEQVENHLSFLCASLLSEEANIVDVMGQEHKELDNTYDVAASTALSMPKAVLHEVSYSTNSRTGLTDSEDSLYFTTMLRRSKRATDDEKTLDRLRQTKSASPVLLPWLPGTGTDVRGCWCAAFTHSTLLSAQLRLHQHFCKDNHVAACAKAADDAHHVLRVTLIRRCSYITTSANVWSQYSLLTHLSTATVKPPVSLTLLHLGSHEADEKVACPVLGKVPLMGLLFLFPMLEIHTFFGSTVVQFRNALALGTRSFPCYPEHSVESLAAGTHAQMVSVPEKFAKTLSHQLGNRDAAVVCIVQSGLGVKDVFLLEDLSTHLRHIVLN